MAALELSISIPNETKRVGGDVVPREFSLGTWNASRAAAATSARLETDNHSQRKCSSALCLFHTIEEAGTSRWAPKWVLFTTRIMSGCLLLICAILQTFLMTRDNYLRHNTYMEAVALYISAIAFFMLTICTSLLPTAKCIPTSSCTSTSVSPSTPADAISRSISTTAAISKSMASSKSKRTWTKLSTITIYLHAFSTTLIPQMLAMLVFHLLRPEASRGIYLISYPLPLVVFLLDVLIMRAKFRLPYRYVILPLYISAPYATVMFLKAFGAWPCVGALASVIVASFILFALTG